MAITYPLTLPSHTGVASITLRAVNQTAIGSSPFTYEQQVFNHQGKRWEAEVQLPAMKRDDAEQWVAWLLSLKGQYGTFELGDPNGGTPRGAVGGSPVVAGSLQTGGSLDIDGCTADVTGWLKAGDYVQVGTQLYKVLQDVDTNSSGEATLELWPNIRTAPADNATVITTNPVGRFRLNSGAQDWSIDTASIYGITFAATEAI
jgi:hypothetical protein